MNSNLSKIRPKLRTSGNVTAYDFMKYARNILNQIAESN